MKPPLPKLCTKAFCMALASWFCYGVLLLISLTTSKQQAFLILNTYLGRIAIFFQLLPTVVVVVLYGNRSHPACWGKL